MRAYWESFEPGAGRRKPRADAVSTARMLDLNGRWRFRLSATSAGTGRDFIGDDFDDSEWDSMAVPSHWVLEPFTPLAGGPIRSMRGTAEGPLYTNTAFPIPLDPPHVSIENPTGDYRLVFEAPADCGHAVLRFQGVDSCAKVWLNGDELGWSTGSRLPFEFDVAVRPGRNVLAVRVHRWSAGTYLEDQDMWWLPGIFRDVELIERPPAAIDDHFVHADYDPQTGLGTLRIDSSEPARVDIPELGVHIAAGETVTMPVEPWSAEVPRLYRGELRSDGEIVALAVGFRRVEIRDGVFVVNGRPVKFRGVNRHEHDQEKGRTLDRDTMIRDIETMKRANIDAVRTSHYPPHPEFLRLCDEYGLWVVEECDIETHGFVFTAPEANPPADPRWRGALLDRVQRMVERDKNHASVVVWSLANESGSGTAFDELEAWVRDRDPSRPLLYERDPSYRDSDFYAVMYPSLDDLERIGRREEDAPDGVSASDDERRRSLPFLLIEYGHAMGNGPGSLGDYWDIIERHDRLCGGFVWEWIDHGFTATTSNGVPFIMNGEDVDYEPCGGRFSLHGLVFSDRTPTPGLVQLSKAYQPIRIDIARSEVLESVVIGNTRHTADTSDLAFRWRVEQDGVLVDEGDLAVPVIEPSQEASVELPAAVTSADHETVVTVTAVLADDTRWAEAGHLIAWGQHVVQTPPREAVAFDFDAARTASADAVHLGAAVFDGRTGRLRRWGDLELDGPWLDLHRAPTENDRGQGDLNDIAAVWHDTGLDRLLHRTDAVEHGDGWLRSHGRTAPASHPHAVEWTMLWATDGDGLALSVDASFVGPWNDTPYRHRDIWVPRLGLLFSLPRGYETVEWYGRGPGETYVDSFDGSRIGRYAADIDALQVPYPVPQENGNHVHTRSLELHGAGLPTMRIDGRPQFDFTARRWTSLDLQRAVKPYELVDSGRVWLNLDHAQQGLGSASVGPALPERYRIPRERTNWSVRLEAN
ncbi:glycoside hydrolase family 2 TIM barrel-domain containing protein [Humibacter sp. RRB41]|uniref:glycoside hydrolase family 2 TIM barrel-domain containing protein n=1 Tax=Humibacter sp. RRB41 TaxID=2919946 RepID=UPI001FAA3B3E|nr:glycoside hydrolase family 2 TIM barrel-domain containing protein [Humibacter sp. RRB41]